MRKPTALRAARTSLGVTQEALAQELSVSREVVGQHDRRGLRNVDLAKKYAAALGRIVGREVAPVVLLDV